MLNIHSINIFVSRCLFNCR